MKSTANASERLAQWMELMRLNDRQVAERVGIDTAYVWRMRTGKRPVSGDFMWRFGQKYGFDVARGLFDTEKVTA